MLVFGSKWFNESMLSTIHCKVLILRFTSVLSKLKQVLFFKFFFSKCFFPRDLVTSYICRRGGAAARPLHPAAHFFSSNAHFRAKKQVTFGQNHLILRQALEIFGQETSAPPNMKNLSFTPMMSYSNNNVSYITILGIQIAYVSCYYVG